MIKYVIALFIATIVAIEMVLEKFMQLIKRQKKTRHCIFPPYIAQYMITIGELMCLLYANYS